MTPAHRDACEIAALLCRRFEGLYLRPYLCPAGVPTIGYGSTVYMDGQRVTLKDPAITAAQAEALLMESLQRTYLPAVLNLCPGARTSDQIGAVLDFTYNLGAGNLQASTLRRRINTGHWHDVPTQLRRWVFAKGRKLQGLQLRREAEIAVIAGGQ